MAAAAKAQTQTATTTATATATAAAPLRVWLGGVSSQSGTAALTALLEYPNVTVTASARDVKGAEQHFKSAVDAKRVTFVPINTAGGVLRAGSAKADAKEGAKDDAGAGAAVDLKGHDTLLLVGPPPTVGNRAEVGPAYAKAAKDAKVKHIILLSLTPSASAHLPINSDLAPFIEAFKATGIPVTIVRVCWFFDNLYRETHGIKATGAFVAPISAGTKLQSLSVNDIGRSGAVCAVGGAAKHGGKDYTIFAHEITYDEWAAALSKAVGVPVAFKTVTPDAFAKALASHGLPEAFVRGFLAIYALLESGAMEGIENALPALLAPRKPETITQWLAIPAVREKLTVLLK